ncbi:uncharacterized protein LOC142335584 isoform X2 [Convolutriloba macropyga]|uniref:uncharacterized protein LOC142335584 isoform X2 n=1 Tax=Convolutriloba macropyga TaxID=536237 RepID=UPI003F52395D
MVVLSEKRESTAAKVKLAVTNGASINGGLSTTSDQCLNGASENSLEIAKSSQMKRKLQVVDNDNIAEDAKNSPENGCRPSGKKHCNTNESVLSHSDVKADPDSKLAEGGAGPKSVENSNTDQHAEDLKPDVEKNPEDCEQRKLEAAKIRAMLMLEETNLLLLKKLKASQTPKPAPSSNPAPQTTASAAVVANSAATSNTNNNTGNSTAVTATGNLSNVPTVSTPAPSLTQSTATGQVPSVQSVNALVNNLQNHANQNLLTAAQQQQQLLQQIQQSTQIKAAVAQQQLAAAAANQRRTTVIPTATNSQVPTVNTNPQSQQAAARSVASQLQSNLASAAKVTSAALPPNVVPNALFRGPPPSVTPGTTNNSTAQNRSTPTQPQQQQPTVRVDPAAAAKREQAAKLALKKQLEKTLLQIPPPRPPPSNLDFLVWPTIEFLYLTGLEETVENVLVNTLMKPCNDKKKDGKKKDPLQCAQCQTDFTTAWKRDSDSGKIICEQCLVNNNKKAVKKEHTNRLKLAVEQALQQEKEVIQKLKEEERKQALANQAAALRVQQQQQQIQQQQQQQQPHQSNNVSAVVGSLTNANGSNSIYAQQNKQHPPLFMNPTLNSSPSVSSVSVNSARPTVNVNPPPTKGRILNPAPGGRFLNPAPGGRR